jgi:hypothetical protein
VAEAVMLTAAHTLGIHFENDFSGLFYGEVVEMFLWEAFRLVEILVLIDVSLCCGVLWFFFQLVELDCHLGCLLVD